ncbi:hypothetical protein F5890DRAFT_1541663 [Lentinula detonsa]|uniref:Uncharacterized protein n=1 Tax=Lentinula detonsa TaxID=2804962 RepID=A0AA38UN11_9AGAR|nr:hypothetical protein F5890DRAFT_1541663 [Lentinula detonsa]
MQFKAFCVMILGLVSVGHAAAVPAAVPARYKLGVSRSSMTVVFIDKSCNSRLPDQLAGYVKAGIKRQIEEETNVKCSFLIHPDPCIAPGKKIAFKIKDGQSDYGYVTYEDENLSITSVLKVHLNPAIKVTPPKESIS